MREAAVMIVINDDGLVLAVSRRNNATLFGLPGGKREPSETSEQAAIRETFEETGITVHACNYLYRREEPPDSPLGEWFYTHCYLALSWYGEPTSSSEGEVKWLKASDLTGEKGAFAIYNEATFARLKEKYPQIHLAE